MNKPCFIKEQEYLNKTLMIPVLKHNKPADSLVDFEKDLMYRRTGKKGLNLKEIEKLQNSSYVLAVNKIAGESLMQEDFRKAKL